MVSSKLVFLSGALQAAVATATMNSDTRVQNFVHNHGLTHDGHNHPRPAQGGNGVHARQGGGEAVVSNRCDYDVWIWSVDQNQSSGAIKVPARSKHVEPIRTVCDGCGVSFKVSKVDHIVQGQHTQFEYSVAGGQLWYNISFVDCAKGESAADCPGIDGGLAIDSPEQACGRFKCDANSYCPTQAYFVDQPLIKLGVEEPVKSCGAAGIVNKLYFKLCEDRPALDKRSVAGRVEVESHA